MQTRQNALNEWLKNNLGSRIFDLTPLAGDASFRRYFRLRCDDKSYVIMDAPPDKETLAPFIQVGTLLRNEGIHTPKVYAAETHQGFLMLEDFGNDLFMNKLSDNKADQLYHEALTTLKKMQACKAVSSLPMFNHGFMRQELNLFTHWFLQHYLNVALTPTEETLLQQTFDWISYEIAKQPQVFIHRDYHSRNIMVLEETAPKLGIIDFQDAMVGPITYDLVSLLKDSYVEWSHEKIQQWLRDFYQGQSHYWSFNEFTQAFNICGLQRHLKVLGVFCRLYLRDQKAGYLKDLPLTFHYVMRTLQEHPELSAFYSFMAAKVQQPFLEKHSC